MTNVLTLFNQKGGVGKSSLALNVAVEMSQRGYRVIAIEMIRKRTSLAYCAAKKIFRKALSPELCTKTAPPLFSR